MRMALPRESDLTPGLDRFDKNGSCREQAKPQRTKINIHILTRFRSIDERKGMVISSRYVSLLTLLLDDVICNQALGVVLDSL